MLDGKTLYLMRHAEASWMESGQRDFERRLNARGKRDALKMGKRLKARNILPDLILSSPAQRASQTTGLIATGLGIPVDAIVFHKTIYEAAVSDLLDIIHSLEDRYASAMLVGHNPAMTWLISQLADEHIANAPTGSVATIRISSDRWKDVATGTSRLLDFDYPKKSSNSKTRHIS